MKKFTLILLAGLMLVMNSCGTYTGNGTLTSVQVQAQPLVLALVPSLARVRVLLLVQLLVLL